MNILYKLQNLSEGKRKIILWLVVIIIGASLLTWYSKNIQQKFKNFQIEKFKEKFKLPSFQEEIKEFPKIEFPKEELNNFEGTLKEVNQ